MNSNLSFLFIRLFKLSLSILFFCMSGYKEDDDKILPKITQEGLKTIGCTVNGRVVEL